MATGANDNTLLSFYTNCLRKKSVLFLCWMINIDQSEAKAIFYLGNNFFLLELFSTITNLRPSNMKHHSLLVIRAEKTM